MKLEAERLEKLLHVYKGLVEVSALINQRSRTAARKMVADQKW